MAKVCEPKLFVLLATIVSITKLWLGGISGPPDSAALASLIDCLLYIFSQGQGFSAGIKGYSKPCR